VLAGDFNATLDHAVLRDLLGTGYIDAAEFTGAGLIATWPVGRHLPPLVTIDHVLVDRRSAAVATSVQTIAGSDHRAVFADLLIRG
jgi:endonuclease/exonuclease/phosphatase (EEP) superfamily protein YafD